MRVSSDSSQPVRALATRRHDEILKRLAAEGSVSIAELAGFFDVSRETIRRDLKRCRTRGASTSCMAAPPGARRASRP